VRQCRSFIYSHASFVHKSAENGLFYPIKFSEASWNSMLSNKKIIPRSFIVHAVNWSARAVVMKPSLGPHLTLFRAHFNEFHALPRLNGRTIQLCANWKKIHAPRSCAYLFGLFAKHSRCWMGDCSRVEISFAYCADTGNEIKRVRSLAFQRAKCISLSGQTNSDNQI
jgi:hypothetical protein